MRKFLVSLFGFFLFLHSLAQQQVPDLKDYAIQVWSTSDGLPSNNLIQVKQDYLGYLWITSYNGLIRFDGHEFEVFNNENIPSLKSNGFSVIKETKDGKIYFGTLTSGLLIYENGAFRLEDIVHNFSGSMNTIQPTLDDELFIGIKNNGIIRRQANGSKFTPLNSALLAKSDVHCILEHEVGHFWIATNKGVINFKNNQTNVLFKEVFKSRKISSFIRSEDRIYAGTDAGIFVYEEKEWHLIPKTGEFIANSIKLAPDGRLWAATETGVLRFEHDFSFQKLSEKDGLPSRQVSSIEFDSEGNIWLTSKRGGLAQLKNSNFINISVKDGLSSQYTNIITELKDGTIIVGNDNGGLDRIKNGRIEPIQLATDIRNQSVKDIIEDRNGVLWIATYNGLLRLLGGREHLYESINGGMVSKNIRSLFEDSKGTVWVGAKDGGIVKLTMSPRLSINRITEGLSDNYVFCFGELANGDILAGTYHGGINRIRPDGSIEVINISPDASSPLVFNIEIESNDTWWLATDVGLFRYHNGNFDKLDITNGLGVTTIFDVYIDPSGYIWATSNEGLVQLSKEMVENVLDGKIASVDSRIFDEKDGMLSRECTGATRMLVASDGRLWIPTSKGISIIDPAHIIINKKEAPVFIKSVIADNVVLEAQDSLFEIPQGTQRVTFKYTALSYYSPGQVRFKYRLRGVEKDWNNVGNQYQATYMNLPDGRFTFEVLASNQDNVWSTVPASVEVRIEPYFYKSRLFYLLLFGFILGITFLIYWIRIRIVEDKNRQLSKLNSELDSFVYSVSHDLRAPLSSILGLVTISKMDSERNNRSSYLDKIENSVLKLDEFIKDIINYSRNVRLKVESEQVNLKQMVDEILESLAHMNTDNSVDVKVDIPDEMEITTDRRRLHVALANIIANAFRYSKNYISDPHIKINARIIGGRIHIQIKDNGIGIKKDQLAKIFDMFYRASENSNGSGLGLYIAMESITKLDGTIKVESVYERGATFTVIIDNS